MLLRVWTDRPYRATRDLDLFRRGEGSFDAVRADLRAICAVPVEEDGIVLDADSIRIESIRAEDEYAGIRGTLWARSGSARLLEAFLLPVLEDLRRSEPVDGVWSPGGPWRPGSNVRGGGRRRCLRRASGSTECGRGAAPPGDWAFPGGCLETSGEANRAVSRITPPGERASRSRPSARTDRTAASP